MSKKRIKIIIGVAMFALLFLFLQLYSVDLLPRSLQGDTQAVESEAKGKAVMQKAWLAHGVDSLNTHEVYQFTAVDHWKGMMAGMGKLWPQKKTALTLKYAPNTFDAQVEFLDGATKGLIAGLQSWNYYEKQPGGDINFKVAPNDRYRFGMAAFQYFTEMVGRLSHAQLIRYAGEETFNGENYHLVFVTWGSLEGNKDHDQYLLYINQRTNMLEYATYTIRDNYLKMPGSGMFYGTMGFNDYRDVQGYKVPFEQNVFLFGPKENNENYLHRLTLSSFSFDNFDRSVLYPDPDIKAIGDAK